MERSQDTTRFGVPASLSTASDDLRLHAALAGIALEDADVVTRAAAVGAAELWAAWTGMTSVSEIGRVSPAAAKTLLTILYRAAGRARRSSEVLPPASPATPAEWLIAFDRVQAWFSMWIPTRAEEAWGMVVSDLAADGVGLVGLAVALEDLRSAEV